MPASFDSANYLRGLGWAGPGQSLNGASHGRAKPVTVVQKKNLGGIGKDRDTSFAWWDAVFTSVATKVGTTERELHMQTEQRITSTGIMSHRPPPIGSSANSSETFSANSGKRLNLDAMAAAKVEYARKQLYSGFMRGTTLKPDEEAGQQKENDAIAARKADGGKGKKRKREDKDEEAAAKKERKEARRVRKAEKAEKKARKESKRAEKEAKRADKQRKRKGKDKAEPVVEEEEDGDLVLVSTSTVEISTTTTPPAELDPSTSPTPSKPSKEERRAAKRLKKSLANALPPLPSAPASASTAPAYQEHLSPEEAIATEQKAYQEARKEQRRKEKEERKLAKVVKKALREKEGGQ
ncbi:hypothetical protein JCM11641_001412 [Rhodosporidiobolus odoratus]